MKFRKYNLWFLTWYRINLYFRKLIKKDLIENENYN